MSNRQLHTILVNQINGSSVSYVGCLCVFVLFTFLLYLRCGGGLAEIIGVP